MNLSSFSLDIQDKKICIYQTHDRRYGNEYESQYWDSNLVEVKTKFKMKR